MPRPKSTKVRKDPSSLQFELERQKNKHEKIQHETRRRVDDLTKFHEKQMRDLHAQHDRDLKLLTHQNTIHIKSLRQSYDTKIQKLLDEQKVSDGKLRKSIVTENKESVEAAIAQQHIQTQQQIESLRADLNRQMQELEASYQQKVQELDATTQKLQEANHARRALEEEKRNSDEEVQKSRAHQDQAVETLRATRTELKAMKKQYEGTIDELRRALDMSKDQLQNDYELISAMKHDKQTLGAQVKELSHALSNLESKLVKTVDERKSLDERLKKSDLDHGTYKSEMHRLVTEEKKQSAVLGDCEQNLRARETKLEQCSMAIREAQQEMDAEKSKLIHLRQEYQSHVDRLASLNEALEKCKKSSADSKEVIQEMNERYQGLKARSDQMIAEMKNMSEENNEYKHNLQHERARLAEMKDKLDSSRVQMQDQLKLLENGEQRTHGMLSQCEQKNDHCLQTTKAQSAHVQKLEHEIKKSMQVLKNSELLERKVTVLDQTAAVREKELESLKHKLSKVEHENQSMRNKITEFESHFDSDDQLMKKYGDLKTQQSKTVLWAEEMKRHHEELHQHHQLVGNQLEETAKKLNLSESTMQEKSSVIRACEKKIDELNLRIKNCLYPGQREGLEAQMGDLIKERERTKTKIQELIQEHGKLFRQMEGLLTENEDLRVIKTRYEMESEQMQKIVQQGAELNVQLNEAKRLITKKDQQLELLSTQLNTLIQRVKTLEDRENMLQEKLKYSSTPEETETLQSNLNNCRSEMKKNTAKFQEMQGIAEHLKEQNQVNLNKVTSLVQVLSETEAARERLQTETQQKADLRKSLQECGENSKRSTAELQQRIQIVEDQYRSSVVSHDKFMNESKARITELQKQVTNSLELERTTRLKAAPVEEPMTRGETNRNLERDSNRVIQDLKDQIARLQKGSPTEMAIRSAALPQAQELQKVKGMQSEAMRDKEHQIMEARKDTYQKLLQTLDTVNSSKSNVKPDDIFGRMRQIRAQGATREQQHMSDMIELRALNTKLGAEYKSARQMQSDVLADANTFQRQQIIQSAQQGVTPALLSSVNTYQNLAGAHRDFLSSQQQDLNRQLEDQKRYISELESHLPLMQGIVNSIDTVRFPNLSPLRNDVQREYSKTLGALNNEAKEAASQDRSVGVVESQLLALQAQVQMLTRKAQEYANNPTVANSSMLQQLAQLSPSEMAIVQQRQQAEADQSAVRSTALTGARPPTMAPPTKIMSADPAKAEIVIHSDKNGLQRYLFDNVLLPHETAPRTVFGPTLARAEDQISKGHDLIAVTYSFAPTDDRVADIKFDVFAHAIRELFPRIQLLAGSVDGKIQAQLVQVTENDKRVDLFSPDKQRQLEAKCKYTTCKSTVLFIDRPGTVTSILDKLKASIPVDQPSENHLILSFSSPSSGAHIHIVDVLFHQLHEKSSEVNEMRLIDNSWIGYLADQVSDPDVKIDLFSNFVPFEADDTATIASNRRIGEIADRIKFFLYQLKKQ